MYSLNSAILPSLITRTIFPSSGISTVISPSSTAVPSSFTTSSPTAASSPAALIVIFSPLTVSTISSLSSVFFEKVLIMLDKRPILFFDFWLLKSELVAAGKPTRSHVNNSSKLVTSHVWFSSFHTLVSRSTTETPSISGSFSIMSFINPASCG